ncbi:MAG TPA: M56 family metallopeptidase [Leptolyngbyaceae cyanobacterium M65_K2018_010]|nr:M56 family metallopeptidase [Leptolyngbyaceae cyanobacterium M65_K2018_010]
MHLSLVALMALMAVAWRWRWRPIQSTWTARWQAAWVAFCLPPLLVLAGAMAVLIMGHHGTMLGRTVSPLGCCLSLAILALAVGAASCSLVQLLWLDLKLRQYPQTTLPSGKTARLMETSVPLAAQVGLWRSALLLSRGVLDTLTPTEQQVILHHEEAHAHYRDSLWFWGLGILRRFSVWLPRTQDLWQELLLLREIRADRWAAQQAEPLLIAELLVKLSQARLSKTHLPDLPGLGFNHGTSLDRLEQRVEALLNSDNEWGPDNEWGRGPAQTVGRGAWLWIGIPLVAIWLHT